MWNRVVQEHKGVLRSKRGERVISDQEPDDGRGWLMDRKKNALSSFLSLDLAH